MRSVATAAAVGAGVGAAVFAIVLAAAFWPAVTDVRVAALVAVGARSDAEPLLMLRQAARHIAAALGWDDAGLLLAAPPGQRGARGHHAGAGDGPPDAESWIGGPHEFTFHDELGAIPVVSQAGRDALDMCATLTVVIADLTDTT